MEFRAYRDEEGKLRAGPVDESEVCDFCMTPNPPWVFPAAEMEITANPVIDRSDDAWGACDKCKDLILASDIDGLVEHALETQKRLHPPDDQHDYPPDAFSRMILKRQFLRFMDARKGPPFRDYPGAKYK